jgi:hypothetical protein
MQRTRFSPCKLNNLGRKAEASSVPQYAEIVVLTACDPYSSFQRQLDTAVAVRYNLPRRKVVIDATHTFNSVRHN